MTIVYCLQALHRAGGIERVITTKANWLAQAGHQVHIVTTDQRGENSAFPLSDQVQLHDLALNYEYDNNLSPWERIKSVRRKRPEHKARLQSLLSSLKADITVSTFFHEAIWLPHLKDGSRKVLEMHTSRYARVNMYPKEKRLMRLYGRYRQYQDERIARRYDAFVILTEAERPLYLYQKKLHTIPNACLLPKYGYSNLNKPYAIAVGRLEYVKNFESLIRIWYQVVKAYPEWQLFIYGEGPLREKLSKLIEQLGLQQSVFLKGNVQELGQYYQECSLCLMTSHFEGLPMVLLEAQTCGLPIIAYNCPSGPREVVRNAKNGLLIPEGDEQAFVQAIISVIQNPNLLVAMSKEARHDAERYNLDTVMNKWQSLFCNLLISN